MVAEKWLEVKCITNISKNGEMSMTGQNVNGSPIGITGMASDNSISIYVQEGGPPVLQPFVCTITVTIRSFPVTQGSHASNSTKDYIYAWTSPAVNICK